MKCVYSNFSGMMTCVLNEVVLFFMIVGGLAFLFLIIYAIAYIAEKIK